MLHPMPSNKDFDLPHDITRVTGRSSPPHTVAGHSREVRARVCAQDCESASHSQEMDDEMRTRIRSYGSSSPSNSVSSPERPAKASSHPVTREVPVVLVASSPARFSTAVSSLATGVSVVSSPAIEKELRTRLHMLEIELSDTLLDRDLLMTKVCSPLVEQPFT